MELLEVPDVLPSFDDVLIKGLLPLLGISNLTVLMILVFLNSLKSWYEGARTGVALGRRAYNAGRTATSRLGPVGVGGALIVSVPAWAAQCVAFTLVYVVGNFVSVFVETVRTNGHLEPGSPAAAKFAAFEQAWGEGGLRGVLAMPFGDALNLDLVAVITLAVAALGALGAFRGRDRNFQSSVWWGFVIALPVSLWFAICAPFAVLAVAGRLLLAGDLGWDEHPELFSALLVSGLYCALMVLSAACLQLAGAAWRGR